MKYKVFQINTDRDTERVKFLYYERTMRDVGKIDMEIYDKVYEGETKPIRGDDERTLESIYMELNTYRHQHPDFKGHSLSVSDIVELPSGRWFCDHVGWQKLES